MSSQSQCWNQNLFSVHIGINISQIWGTLLKVLYGVQSAMKKWTKQNLRFWKNEG